MTVAAPATARHHAVIASAAVLLGAADSYVVVTILPSILAATGLDLTQLNQAAPIVTGFLGGYVCALPLAGRLSDVRGRTPVLVTCLLLFAVGSVVSGSANDLWQVVLGRTLQGAGGGGLVPVTLALVADGWTAERRGPPLGAVGAAQEIGSLAGPPYGAGLAAAARWRAIFYVNLPVAAVVAAALVRWRRRRATLAPAALVLLTLAAASLAISAPPALAGDAGIGVLFTPLAGGVYATAPLPLLAIALGTALVGGAAVRWRTTDTAPVDWTGALLAAVVLAMVVVTFAGADPARAVIATGAPLYLGIAAAAAALFALRELRTRQPLVDLRALATMPAIGSLAVSAAVGVALIAALVDVPVLARATVAPDSQVDAAFILARLLVAVPVGALVGGLLVHRTGARALTCVAMLVVAATLGVMSTWDAQALAAPWGASWLHRSDAVLAAAGLGFGLVIAPVNAAMLAAVPAAMHGVAASLTVAARMIGMLTGLSLLTAIGLQRFTSMQASIPTATSLCPRSPLSCPAYNALESGLVLDEVHVIFLGAAIAAGAGAALALLLRLPKAATLSSP